MKKSSLLFLFFLIYNIGFAQNTNLVGEVVTNEEASIAGIHVINKSQKKYATTNNDGTFVIEAITGDTIVFSAVQFKLKTIIVSLKNISNKQLKVKLELKVNELPEAIIGFTLTGDLLKDVSASDAKPSINFYDLGIPGYKGKPKTKSERLLFEAGEFKPKMLLGLLTGGLPLNPILNGLSGRTKALKQRVALEANETLMYAIKGRLSETFFKGNPLKEELIMDFFYFCAEDENFISRCGNSDLEALIFMNEKYLAYKENIKSKE